MGDHGLLNEERLADIVRDEDTPSAYVIMQVMEQFCRPPRRQGDGNEEFFNAFRMEKKLGGSNGLFR